MVRCISAIPSRSANTLTSIKNSRNAQTPQTMIQRIQSLYLLLAAILVAVANFFPLAHCKVEEGFYTLDALGVSASGVSGFAGNTLWCWTLIPLSVVTLYFILAALFGYKNRIAQMRRCIYAILTILLYYIGFGMAVWNVYDATATFPDLALMAECPLIAIILLFLAGRAIKRDEDLVRSMDRIR